MSPINVPSNFLCSLCADILACAHALSGSSPRILRLKPKRCLCSKSGEDKKKVLKENERFLCPKTGEKKILHPKSIDVCARKVYCCNFVIETYVCARIENV